MATVFNNLRETLLFTSAILPFSVRRYLCGPPAGLLRQNEMSDLLEYVAVAAGLESDWAAAAGDAIGNGHTNKSATE